MNADRLKDIAWEAIDGQEYDFALVVSPKEMIWLLGRWPRGKQVLAQMRKEHAAARTEAT